MPRSITQYRVFIASPGGLEAERRCFRERLEKCSRTHGEHQDVQFHPVGWEDTLGGVGRPQALINQDLEQCDYAVFVLHDRWGSPTGNGHTSGTEEEWTLAEQLYEAKKIRNIILCFKNVDLPRLNDPGEQLKSVLAFKKKIESDKKYFFSTFQEPTDFGDMIDKQLADWLNKHTNPPKILSSEPIPPSQPAQGDAARAAAGANQPPFAYWLAEARQIRKADTPSHADLLFCATKAEAAAGADGEWAQAANLRAIAFYELGRLEEASTAFGAIADRLAGAADLDTQARQAGALYNKGVTLGAMDRSAEEIAVYDDLIARFGDEPAPAVREQVAKALFNKAVTLASLDRSAEAIAAYDNLITRFGDDPTPALHEPLAKALFNKGVSLGLLDRSQEATAVYDDLVARFGDHPAPVLREQVARALLNKGVTLGDLDRSPEAIAAYDNLIARFGDDPAPTLREQVARTLFNKAVTLGEPDPNAHEIAAYDDLIARFGDDPAPALRELVARALLNKGLTLGVLDLGAEAIAVYDDLIARFGDDPTPALRERIAKALFNKGITLTALDRNPEAITAYDDLIARLGDDPAPALREWVTKAKSARDDLL